MSEREKMLAGELYRADDPQLVALRLRAQRLMRQYNATVCGEDDVRDPILKALFGEVGAGSVIRTPVYVDYGRHIVLGRDCFLNYGCCLLDVCSIEIGSGTQIGSAVQILTADHPRDPELRATGQESGRPITIGRNVWVGSAAIILPGITIGDNAIVGAGSVVTRDVPANRTVVGNPARLRPAS